MLFLLIVNKAFPAWAISGQTNVCASINGNCITKYSYTLTGFPAGSTNHYFSSPVTIGGMICSTSGDSFMMSWLSDCSSASAQIQINTASWYEQDPDYPNDPTKKVLKSYTGPITLSVNVARLGPISSNAWNVSPYACNTNSITYSIPAVCGATNYSWVIPAGWSPSGPLTGANVTSITVTPTASTGGTIGVYANNSSNGCNLQRVISANISRPVQPPVFSTTQKNYCATASAQINVNPVTNASSYSWTYPSGWSGPATTTTPYTTVNFNGVQQTANLGCQTNATCGGTSVAVQFSMSYSATLPTDAGIAYTVAITGTAPLSKKIVTVTISSCFWQIAQSTPVGGGYQSVYLNNNYAGSSPTSTTTNLTMKNGDRVLVSVHNQNACGSSAGTGVGYQLVNGNLEVLPDVGRLVTTSTNKINSENENFNIYPNPVSTLLTVKAGKNLESNENIVIYNLLGEKVKEIMFSQEKEEINVSDLENGIYFIQIESANTILRKEKIVVSH